MWENNLVYRGDLFKYPYPTNKEVGELLGFLKRVNTSHRVYLIDVPRWNLPMPPTDYDIYIMCMFGEAVNEDYIIKLDQHPDYVNKQIILLTSQFYLQPVFTRTRVFYIEHLHTVIPFLPRPDYTRLANRQFTHSSLSHRNAIHKTILTAKLLNKFGTDLQYSFCNGKSNEYTDPQKVIDIMTGLGFDLSNDIDTINTLHYNPVTVDGPQWGVDNPVYHNSQLIWTAESMFVSRDDGPTAYITEKLMKAMISGSPFIAVSQKNTLERLKLLGFETYEKEFGIYYDNKSDIDRYTDIFDLIDNFNLKTVLESATVQDIADYNHNYFYTDFYNLVEKNNIELIDQLIEYLNEI
jgi:hypothetical protein